jgi:hypothetical protein
MLICRLKAGKILAAVKDVAAISPYLSLLISSTQIRCAWRMSLLSHHDGGRQPLASLKCPHNSLNNVGWRARWSNMHCATDERAILQAHRQLCLCLLVSRVAASLVGHILFEAAPSVLASTLWLSASNTAASLVWSGQCVEVSGENGVLGFMFW